MLYHMNNTFWNTIFEIPADVPLSLKMQNFQVIVFIWTQTNTEIFKSALMYIWKLLLRKTDVLKTLIFYV